MNKKVHFVGIGGIGVSALARYFLSEGWEVQGSDMARSSITDELSREGFRVTIGKHAANMVNKNVSRVIYTQAVSRAHPELVKAERLGILAQSYPEAVGSLTKQYKTIAIAGSHGKSTTTAMVASVLEEGGMDPTVIVGTKLPQWGSNFRKGSGGWLVLEADEWKASFLHYFPAIAAITNIDKEHLDFYKTFANVKRAFEQFKGHADKIIAPSRAEPLAREVEAALQVPGAHNVQNALIAYAIGKELGIPHAVIIRGLKKYRGAWRRMEYRGTFAGADVYDDYGHHPTEIKATLAAFRHKWPKKPLICVFQPHQGKRLKALFPEFTSAFRDAHETVLLPVYEVAGRDAAIRPAHSSEALAKAVGATYIKDPKNELRRFLSLLAGKKLPNAIIVMMGAGDIIKYTDELLRVQK